MIRSLPALLLFLLVFTGITITATAQNATVTTDKGDYAPGETVVITGTGFLPGEAVVLKIEHIEPNMPVPMHYHAAWQVIADKNGEITASWFVNIEELNTTLLLSVSGQTSRFKAETVFTDANRRGFSTAVVSGAPVNTCSGASVPLSLNVTTCAGFGGNSDYTAVYLWEQSFDNSTWTTATGTSNISTYIASPTSNTYYHCVITITGNYQGCGVAVGSSYTTASSLITVNTTPSAPTGSSAQSFCSGASPTVANLAATGTAIQWYAASSGGSPLAASTALATATHYYASQTINGCESTARFDVLVTVDPATVPGTVNGSATVCTGTNSTILTLTGNTGNIIKWQSSTNNWTSSTDISNTTTSYTATNLTVTTQYRAVVQSGVCSSANSLAATVTVVSPVGDPAVFGNNQWNVYAYNGANMDLSGIIYQGYYTVTGTPSFNTIDSWGNMSSPSSASGYQGCPVVTDYFTFVHKRQGFTCGSYQIDCYHDDDARLYIDDILVWSSAGFGSVNNIWTGVLNANSKVEYRVMDGNGASSGALTFTYSAIAVPTALAQTFCSASNPIVANLVATGTGTLNWYNVSSGGTSLSGSTALATGTYYVSQTISGCESARTSVSVTVNTSPSAPAGNNPTITFTGVANTTAISATPGSGETIDWYDAATSGNKVATGANNYIPTAVNAATYTYYAEARNTTSGCVSTTRTQVTLTITAAVLTYMATASGKTYGDTNPAFSGTITGFVGTDTQANSTTGTLAFSSVATATSAVGSYAINGSGLTANNGNYTFAQAAGNATALTISQRSLNFTGTRGYDGSVTFTAAQLTAGNIVNSDVVTLGGSATVSAKDIATYTSFSTNSLTSSNGNYKVTGGTVNVSITAAVLTYTANTVSKTYGDANPSLSGTVTGFATGDNLANATTGTLTFTSPATATSGVGGYAITGSGLTANNGNYTFIQASGNATALTISQRALSFTGTRGYDGSATFTAAQLTAGNIVNSDAVTLGGSATVSAKDIGTYTSFATNALISSNANYKVTGGTVNVSITAAVLTYTANTASKTYGDANPSFSGTVTGFATGDNLANATTGTLTFTSPATATSGVGGYAITGSGLTANNGNYTFIQASGNATALTITKRPLTITASNRSKCFGDADSFNGTEFTSNGLVNGDVINTVTLTSGGTDAGATAGTYSIVPSTALGTGLGNYTISYVNGTFTVNPKPVIGSFN